MKPFSQIRKDMPAVLFPKHHMRVLVCGDRRWTETDYIFKVFREFRPKAVIEGEANGADYLSRLVANQLQIRVCPFPAQWKEFGRAAGPIRNTRMLVDGKPHVVFAFHNSIDESKGTKDMIRQAIAANITVVLFCTTKGKQWYKLLKEGWHEDSFDWNDEDAGESAKAARV